MKLFVMAYDEGLAHLDRLDVFSEADEAIAHQDALQASAAESVRVMLFAAESEKQLRATHSRYFETSVPKYDRVDDRKYADSATAEVAEMKHLWSEVEALAF